MNIEIKENFNADVYGFAGIATNGNWADTGISLMNKMWHVVKANNLANKGINIWIYEGKDQLFAGVELNTTPSEETGLEHKTIQLARYVYYKHIGPYNQIGQACSNVLKELEQQGIKTCWPYLEVYGHWTEDASKLETELLWCLL